MKRAALLQLGGVHEEIVPSLVAALGPEWEVHAWITEACRTKKGDIFAEIPQPNLTVHYRTLNGHPAWDEMRAEVLAFAPDIIIAATFQNDGMAKFIDTLETPAVGVVHNLRMAGRVPQVMQMFGDGRCQPVVLADHVRAGFNRIHGHEMLDRIAVVEPVHWGTSGIPDMTCRRIAIPGGVNAANRDFDGLIRALGAGGLGQRLGDAGAAIEVLGGGPDRARLQDEVAQAGLADVMRFAPLAASGRVPYETYLGALRGAWALLPLIQLSKNDYRDFKITSAVTTAVGFGLPMVLDRWTASVYRAPCVVSDVSIAASLEALLDLSDTAHKTLRQDIKRYRTARLATNQTEMARALKAALKE